MTTSNLNYLASKHQHERDSRIVFEDEGHKYTIDGVCGKYTSVTTLVHKQFGKFDADTIIKNMMASPKWRKSKYFGKTSKEIKKIWDDTGNEAATAGNKLHLDIEYYYNNCPRENDSTEYTYFNNFIKCMDVIAKRSPEKKLIPYRTEWTVFDDDIGLAGSIDMCFTKPDGTIAIYDWKRSKEIKKTSFYVKYSKNPVLSHIPDLNYWHYSLQLNLYKKILERKYGKTVSEMWLVCLHPNHKNYQRISVVDMSAEVNELLRV